MTQMYSSVYFYVLLEQVDILVIQKLIEDMYTCLSYLTTQV